MQAVIQQVIQRAIQAHPDRRIPFRDFMDLALYHPQYGYYNHRAQQIGPSGDFFTAPHLGADFGELLAEQFVQMWHLLGSPQSFSLVEMGAGQGLLAQDILRYLEKCHRDCFDNLEYIIIEKAAGLITQQQRQLQSQFGDRINLHWQTLESLQDRPITGCFFSNELVDAFPVHRVEFVNGELQEIYVTHHQQSGQQSEQQSECQSEQQPGSCFCEILAQPSTPDLEQYFELIGCRPIGSDYPDRYRTEVNLAALNWLSSVAAALEHGYILTIDYGYPASRYYNRVRSQGTLQCYYQHSHHNDPYIHIGQQDITAHVDFTSLERQGDCLGLTKIGVTQQAMFLMSLGLGDRIAALGRSDSTDPQEIFSRLQRRDALHQLANPMGMGNFGVLIQAKGLSPQVQAQTLQGLAAPVASNLFSNFPT
jgi:SAM-dependent MidA family methyltransferase